MKSTSSKSLALLLLVILSASVAGLARGGRHQRQDHPARREVRTYVEANVLPVLRQQRQKLEPQLAPADRAQLATYRAQLKTLREQGRALRQAAGLENAAPGTRPTLTDTQLQQAQQLRSQARTLMLNVALMDQKYQAPIGQLAREVQPQKEQWATDIKAIVAKNTTPEQQENLAAHQGWLGERCGLRRFFKPAMFLLMDPNAPATGRTERDLGNTSFYPNPAAATSQLDYEVKKEGPVTVDLLDGSGNKLRTLVADATAEKGPHTQQLDLHDLPAGTYFYKITTQSSNETKRFVKE